MTTRKLGLFALVLTAGILSACDDPTPVPVVEEEVVVTVVPDTATLTVGQTRQLVAVVVGSTNQAVTWSTSAANFATVSATGLVTAVAAGTAVITAVSQADATARDAAVINVVVIPPPPPPSIVITGVTQGGTTNPVNPQNVAGQIDVTAELNVPQGAVVQRVEFLLDNAVLPNCTQTFTSGGSADIETDQSMVPLICSINTADFNATTGAPAFPNGPHTVSARVVNPAGTITATTSQPLVFNNVNIVRLTVTPQRTAPDAAGLVWGGGSLGATLLATLYTGGTLASATFTVSDAAAGGSSVGPVSITQAVTAAGPVTVTFPATTGTNNLAGFEDAGTTVTATTIIAGQAGPTANQNIRLDEVAPTVVGALTFPAGSNGWVGPNVSIASLTAGFTGTDAGVNVVVKAVQWKVASGANSTFATVNAIGDLAETTTNVALDLRGQACDALTNCAVTAAGGQDAGVDKTPPTDVAYTLTSPANMSIVVGPGVYALTGSDGLSGPNDFLATLQRLNTNNTTTCVVGAVPSSGVCNRVSSLTNAFVQQATEGYYTFGGGSDSPDLVFRDQALNTTSIAGRIAVRDVTMPAVGNIVLPATLPSGGTAAFSATATDNLDINASVFRTIYAAAVNGGAELTYGGPTAVGAFGAPLLQSSPLTASVSFIRSIEATGAGGVPAGAVSAATGARFDVSDFGGNTATAFNNFAAGTVPAGSSATGLGLTDWNGATSVTPICDNTGANSCGAVATSANLTGVARGTSGTFGAPFSRVIFYINNAGVRTFLGETTVRASTDNGVAGDPVGRVWTYGPVAFAGAGRGPAAPGSTAYSIEAVGVDSNGDALFSQLFTVTVNKP